ncbi:hypothetical protein GCM10011415_02690 [Salipiger pallidus]|uniref:Uncharacterized protein n=1 Tax=Salipiger pallidus TaxID=1775170 RepID=A0A8J2ZGP6_9RHOB|nr:hypothetical protein [Salipiger pallidus]GGG60245.1 hypothetical protein GCM10011415_02690 [Salipiger pallidus]
MPDIETRLTTIEARLIAHRKLLARLVELLGPEEKGSLTAWIKDREILRDGQEDPAALPTEVAVLPLGIAEEFQEIRALIDRRGPRE